jgi:hypothetical protein
MFVVGRLLPRGFWRLKMGILDKLVNKFLDMEIPGTKQNTSNVPDQYSEIWNRIPQDVKELLFYTNEIPNKSNHSGLNTVELSFGSGTANIKYNDHVRFDPSRIYFKLPIMIPKDIIAVNKLPYMPSYVGMSPEQRYVYLTWLQDIANDIDVGYMFLFYYGLEWRLLIGPFEKAFDMIVRLRKNTKNGSFLAYSGNSLFYTSVISGRKEYFEKLHFLFDDEVWYDKQIMLKFFEKEPVFPNELSKILKGLNVNKRYLDEKVYIELMGKLISEKYGHSYLLPQESIDEDKVKEEDTPIFANFSMPDNIRITKVPHPDLSNFKAVAIEFHNHCHEFTKQKLADLRKKKT